MIDNLIHHIENYIIVSEGLRERLSEIAVSKKIEKGKYLHKPNKICKNTYFINSGLLRIFYKKSEKEITDNFTSEGEWITSIYSFLKNVPDSCYIQTLEDSDLVAIDFLKLEKCFKDFPEMERFGRMLISQYFVEQSERIISLQFHTAKERYNYFLTVKKNIIQRVPLGMLASHLGMTQETLSRVRAEKTPF